MTCIGGWDREGFVGKGSLDFHLPLASSPLMCILFLLVISNFVLHASMTCQKLKEGDNVRKNSMMLKLRPMQIKQYG